MTGRSPARRAGNERTPTRKTSRSPEVPVGWRSPAWHDRLIGRLRSISVTFVAALVIGLVHDLITPITQLTNYQDMTPFVLATIALLVMSRGQVMTRSREEG